MPAGLRRLDRPGLVVYGAVAEAEGKDREALAAYLRWNQDNGGCIVCGLYESALVYDRLGKPDSALSLLEQVTSTRSVQKALFVDSYALAPSLKRLGELYETKGDKKKAVDYYARFVDLWKNADSELQPTVRDVRGRACPPRPGARYLTIRAMLSDRDLFARLVAFDTTSHLSNLPMVEFLADYLDRPGVRIAPTSVGRWRQGQPARRRRAGESDGSGPGALRAHGRRPGRRARVAERSLHAHRGRARRSWHAGPPT